MEQYLPNLDDANSIRDEFCDAIYAGAEDIFENVRQCNSDMRDEAEYQIEDLEDEIDGLKHEKDTLEWEIDELKDEIEDLKNTILNLEEDV